MEAEAQVKFVKNVRQRGAWPEHAWGYGPAHLRMTLAIREHIGGGYVINTSGMVRVVPEEEARRMAEVAMRELNLRVPDATTQEILHRWGLLANPSKPRGTTANRPVVPPREMRVGFSEIPVLMGLSPYLTPLRLWRIKKGLEKPAEETFPMRWGKEAEAAALRIVQEQLGLINWRIWRQYPAADGALAGHLDAVAAHKGQRMVLEIKVLSSLSAMDAYRAQVHAQMGASGIHDGRLCVVYLNRELIIETVEFDPDLYQHQKALAEDFMRRVREANPPLPESMAVKPSSDTLTVQEGELVKMLEEYQQLTAQMDPLKERLEKIKEELKLAMLTSNLRKVVTPTATATLRVEERESLDTKALKAAHPELAAQFVKRTEVKTLIIK